MATEDQLRAGTLSEGQLVELEQRYGSPLRELEQRLGSLEENASGDGAAFPALYIINEAGEVEPIPESAFVESLVEEEGDLIVGGKGKKAKTLKKGKPGQVLGVDKAGEVNWQEPPSGGLEGARGQGELTGPVEDAEVPNYMESFAVVTFAEIGFEPAQFFTQALRPPGSENPGETNGLIVAEIDPVKEKVFIVGRFLKLTPGPFLFNWVALK